MSGDGKAKILVVDDVPENLRIEGGRRRRCAARLGGALGNARTVGRCWLIGADRGVGRPGR